MLKWEKEFCAKICHEANKSFCESVGDLSQLSWSKEKVEDGWVYGEMKDAEKKTHPCLVPYKQLPVEQQSKDYIFKGIVDAFKKYRNDGIKC